MKLAYTNTALRALETVPVGVRRALYKQLSFLLQNLNYPSLRAKRYSEAEDRWQARVNKSWRFYFKIAGDTYIIEDVTPHPK